MTKKEYLKILPQKVKELVLNGSDSERIEFINKPKFIKHPKYIKLSKKLDNLLYAPKTNRIRSMLLVGNSNNGKTDMVKEYANSKELLTEDDFIRPVIYIQAPNRANIHELYDSVFMDFGVPYSKSESLVEREQKIKYYCDRFERKMIIIDEIQNALTGSITKQKEFMNGIKNLSNILQIPIVLIGIPKGVNLIYNDHQLKSRFVPTKIKNWEFNNDYFSLLYAIELTLPLKKASLVYEDISFAEEILELSDGLIGDIITIMGLLAKKAIENGDEKITKSLLKKIDYIPACEKSGEIYADEI